MSKDNLRDKVVNTLGIAAGALAISAGGVMYKDAVQHNNGERTAQTDLALATLIGGIGGTAYAINEATKNNEDEEK